MKHADALAETRAESRHGLGREGYLRHQHDRVAALLQHARDGLKVYLGFAAACDAVKQEHVRRGGRTVRREHGEYLIQSGALFARELERERRDDLEVAERIAVGPDFLDVQDAGLFERAELGWLRPGHGLDRVRRRAGMERDELDCLRPDFCAQTVLFQIGGGFLRGRQIAPPDLFGLDPAAADRRRQQGAQSLFAGAAVIVGDPCAEFREGIRYLRHVVADLQDLLQVAAVGTGNEPRYGRRTRLAAFAERHVDLHAGLNASDEVRRDQIIEGPVKRQVDKDLHCRKRFRVSVWHKSKQDVLCRGDTPRHGIQFIRYWTTPVCG